MGRYIKNIAIISPISIFDIISIVLLAAVEKMHRSCHTDSITTLDGDGYRNKQLNVGVGAGQLWRMMQKKSNVQSRPTRHCHRCTRLCRLGLVGVSHSQTLEQRSFGYLIKGKKGKSEHLYSALHGTNQPNALRHGSHSF